MKKTIWPVLILWLCLPARSAQLRVLTLNIQTDASDGRLPGIAWLIRASSADVVGLQEAEKIGPDIAKLLGFNYRQLGSDTALLSRFEIDRATYPVHGAVVVLKDGRRITVFDIHPYYKPYQPYQLLGIPYEGGRFIKTEAKAIDEARKARGGEIDDVLKELASTSGPVLLLGDFNEPSHLDWTNAAAAAHRHPIAVAWPATKAFADVGFKDAYRVIYPDVIAKPGYTWTPTTSQDDPKDHHDRIDFILYRGEGLKASAVQIVGEKEGAADIVVAPYPTDHRAVVATFSL